MYKGVMIQSFSKEDVLEIYPKIKWNDKDGRMDESQDDRYDALLNKRLEKIKSVIDIHNLFTGRDAGYDFFFSDSKDGWKAIEKEFPEFPLHWIKEDEDIPPFSRLECNNNDCEICNHDKWSILEHNNIERNILENCFDFQIEENKKWKDSNLKPIEILKELVDGKNIRYKEKKDEGN